MTILDQLADLAKVRVAVSKCLTPLEDVKQQAHSLAAQEFPFENALKKPGISLICECKKASPSKGLIAPEFPICKSQRNSKRQTPTASQF